MKINFFCPYWGSEHLSITTFLDKVKRSGYDGVEFAVAKDTDLKILDDLFRESNLRTLQVIIQHYDTTASDFEEHRCAYAAWFKRIVDYECIMINSQTGKDYFNLEQNKVLFDIAHEHERQTQIKVVHETHRNKFSFCAHITKSYLEQLKDLRITLDISHWVNVAESYLEDQKDAVDLAISRTDHLHARVGFPEGPQINDPRAPEWKDALDHHLTWWDNVIETRKNKGYKNTTITPEFGPYPYMPSLPYTKVPVADQWSINQFMMKMLRHRYT